LQYKTELEKDLLQVPDDRRRQPNAVRRAAYAGLVKQPPRRVPYVCVQKAGDTTDKVVHGPAFAPFAETRREDRPLPSRALPGGRASWKGGGVSR